MLIISYSIGVVVVFLTLLQYIILIQVILSWLTLFRIQIRVPFFEAITAPIYRFMKRYIPTSFWPFDLAPAILFIAAQVIASRLLPLSPFYLPL